MFGAQTLSGRSHQDRRPALLTVQLQAEHFRLAMKISKLLLIRPQAVVS